MGMGRKRLLSPVGDASILLNLNREPVSRHRAWAGDLFAKVCISSPVTEEQLPVLIMESLLIR